MNTRNGIIHAMSRIIALFALFVVAAAAQGAYFPGQATTVRAGNVAPVPYANVYVCASGVTCSSTSAHVTVYSDAALTQAITQPIVADAYGNFGFYASPAAYVYNVSGRGIQAENFTITLPPACDGNGNCSAKSIEQVRYADQYGASPSNSAAVNTTALQAWLNSGGIRLYLPDGVYTTNELTLPSNIEIFGPGTLRQATAGFDIFYCTGCSNVWIHGLTFQGVGGNGISPAPGNEDNAIHVAIPSANAAATNIRIDHCVFTGFLHTPAWIQNANGVKFEHNLAYSSGGLVRLEGVSNFSVIGNVAWDTSLSSTIFQAAIAMPGTTGGYANNAYGVIEDNTISNYANTQAVLLHGGSHIDIEGNTLDGVNQGVGIGPAGASDVLSDINVIGNEYVSTTTAGGSIGNQCVNLGGTNTQITANVVVSGNTCINANKVDQNAGEGAIDANYTQDVLISGNNLSGSYNSGIFIGNPNTRLTIRGNNIASVNAIAGVAAGIYLDAGAGAQSGWIAGNTISSIIDGIQFAESQPNLVIGQNNITNASTAVLGGSAAESDLFYGPSSWLVPGEAHPRIVITPSDGSICIGAGSVVCDVSLTRGAGGTAAFNTQVAAPSLNLNSTGVLSTTAQSGTGSIVMTSGASINATSLQQGGVNAALQGVDINASNQITATHLASPLPTAQGGTGVNSTATFPGSGTVAVTSQLPLSGTTASIGGSALVAGACSSGTVTVTGATTSMVAEADPTTYPGDGAEWAAYVSAANTVTVKVCAIVALTPTASTYNVRVIQ